MLRETLKAGALAIGSRFSKKHKKAGVLLCVILCCLFLALSSAPRDRLATLLDSATKGTPLEGLGQYIRSADKDLDHPKGGGEMRYPADGGVAFLPEGSYTREGKNIVGRVLEDSNLKKDFIWDIARYLVASYTPGPSPSLCSLREINAYLGGRINIQAHGGRSAMLRYVFQPTMLRGLYHLYVEYLFDTFGYLLRKKHTSAEISVFYGLLETRIGDMARAITAILSIPEVGQTLEAYEKFDDIVDETNAQLAVDAYDASTDGRRSEDAPPNKTIPDDLALATLRDKVRDAELSREQALRQMVAATGLEQDEFLTDDTVLFLAQWVKRRLEADENGDEALRSAVQILYDLEVRFRHKAETAGQDGNGPSEYSATLVQDADMTTDTAEDTVTDTAEEKGKERGEDTVHVPSMEISQEISHKTPRDRPGQTFEIQSTEDRSDEIQIPERRSTEDRSDDQASQQDSPERRAEDIGEPTPNDGLPMTIQIPIH